MASRLERKFTILAIKATLATVLGVAGELGAKMVDKVDFGNKIMDLEASLPTRKNSPGNSAIFAIVATLATMPGLLGRWAPT